jgi:transposase
MRSIGIRDISRERFEPGSFVPAEHPLRRVRSMIDSPLGALHDWLHLTCPAPVSCSITPEQLVRALLLQVLYSFRRNRQLVEQIWYSKLFRWFVGISGEAPKWNQAIFSMYREQMLEHEIIREVLVRVLSQARREGLVSAEALAAGQSELARFAHDGAIGAGQPRPRGCLAESAPVTRRTCDCGPAQAAGATAASDASAWTKR